MRCPTILAVIAVVSAALAAQSCAAPRAEPSAPDISAAVFLRKAGGWVLSSDQPRFPYNSEPGPRLEGMSGAAGATPFGCGLTQTRSNYFTGQSGRLTCVTRAASGALRLHKIQPRVRFSRVYDAAPSGDGWLVVAEVFGRAPARAIYLDADGGLRRSADLPGDHPDQVVILKSGRIATLDRPDAACVWSLLSPEGEGFKVAATVAAETASQCHASSTGGEVLRDQVSGQAYWRPGYPRPNTLYRIDDHGDRLPATVIAADFGADVDQVAGSDPDFVTVHGGAVYFNAATPAGPVVGRYDLATGETKRTDLRSPDGRWQSAGRIYGLMTAPGLGVAPKLVVMDPGGTTRVIALTP